MASPSALLPPLKTTIAVAKAKLESQIQQGEALRSKTVHHQWEARHAFEAEKQIWISFTAALLHTLFRSDTPAQDFSDKTGAGINSGTVSEFLASDRRAILRGVTVLRSLADRLKLLPQSSVERAIPMPVIAVAAQVVTQLYTHADIDSFVAHARIPGEPVDRSKPAKVREWLMRANDAMAEPLAVLGRLLLEYMEVDPPDSLEQHVGEGRDKIRAVLSAHRLAYRPGGSVVRTDTGSTSRALREIIQSRDLSNMEAEFERIAANLQADPPAAVTAACSLLEALFKGYIEERHLEMPSDQSIKPLWNVVRNDLRLDPSRVANDDLRKILSGMASIVDGTGSLRTHKGSAHGQGRKAYKLRPRHARLAVHAASTLALFVLETWDEQGQTPAPEP